MSYAITTWHWTPDTWEHEYQLIKIKYLIKTSNAILTLSDGNWVDTGLSEPLTQEDFEQYGMNDISFIPTDKWNELELNSTEILVWVEDATKESMQLSITGRKNFLKDLSNPSILMYTDDLEVQPTAKITGVQKDNYYRYQCEVDDTSTDEPTDKILIPLTDWKTTDVFEFPTIPAGFVNKMSPYNVKVTVEQFDGKIISATGKILLFNQSPIFILGTVSYNTLSAIIDDPDKDKVQYQILLNGIKVYPENEEWSILHDTPFPISYTFNSKDVLLGRNNTVLLKVRDEFGVEASLNLTFEGTYVGLMFSDSEGNYYSTDSGEVLKYLDFGVFFAGFDSDTVKVRLINQNYFPVRNLTLTLNKANIAPYTDVKISKTGGDQFNGQDSLDFPDEIPSGGEVEFYVKAFSHKLAKGMGMFEIIAKAEPVI